MNDVERAAILLLGMGEHQAAEILKFLSPKQIQKLGLAMAKINNVTKQEIQDVTKKFILIATQQTNLGVDSEDYIRTAFNEALGPEKASGLLANLFEKEEEGLDSLRWLDAKAVSDMLRAEHPQIVATILTYLDSDQTAQVLAFYPKEKVVDLLLRMSSLNTVRPEALSELGRIIEQQLFLSNKKAKGTALGGVKNVAEVVNYFESTLEDYVLNGIKSVDSSLAQQIRELMFVFEDLPQLDARSMQTLLRELSQETLVVALKGASDPVKEYVFANMSKRNAENIRDEIESKGPIRISIVESAQKEILAIAQRLADAGQITLGKGNEEMVS